MTDYFGTTDDDTILGTVAQDMIAGRGGNDALYGLDDDDRIYGEEGDDTLDGGAGDDTLDGGEGHNRIDGDIGADWIATGSGDDEIDGGAGDDVVRSGHGRDLVRGGDGDDHINSGGGDDNVRGGRGDDTVWSGSGDDKVWGGDGDDEIHAGKGDDTVWAGSGDDMIAAGSGRDEVHAGTGHDWVVGGTGNDRLFGDGGWDTAVFSGSILDAGWRWMSSGELKVVSEDGRDRLKDFEFLRFDDYTFRLDGDNKPLAILRSGTETGENTAFALAVDLYDFDGDPVTVVSVRSDRGSVSATEDLAATVTARMGSSEGIEISFDPGTDFDHLAEGETAVEKVFLVVEDSDGHRTKLCIPVTVTGTNDAPVAVADAAVVLESEAAGDVDLNVLDNDTDIDNGAVLSVVPDSGILSGGGLYTLNADGSLDIDANGAYEHLGVGQHVVETLNYTVTDEHGATDTATVAIAIQGENDAPDAVDDVLAGEQTGEFLVNQETFGNQEFSSLTTLANGGFVVTWSSFDGVDDTSANGVKARIFDADGTEVVGEFLVNVETNFNQQSVSVTALVDGGFVVTWMTLDGVDDTSVNGTKARIFEADGTERVGEFLVSDTTYGIQDQPSVTALASGGFVVAWRAGDGVGDPLGSSVKARIFDADGTDLTGNILVNEVFASSQDNPSVAGLANGGFAVTWVSYDGVDDTSLTGIKARVFDANGTEVVSEFLVNEQTNSSQFAPAVTGLSPGGFVVTWYSNDGVDDTSGDGIKARIFDADGTEVAGEFLVNDETNSSQSFPSVTALANGGFVVTWRSYDGVDDTSGSGIKARVFNADGTEAVGEFLVNELTDSNQENPSVTALPTGGFVVTWMSYDGVDDSSGSGIKARIFNADGTQADTVANEDTPTTIASADLLANDSDPDGDPLIISAVSATSTMGATVSLNLDGSVGYDPTGSAVLNALALGETAEDSFTYTISDGNGGYDTATVTLTVAGVNDTPVAAASSVVGDEDTPINGTVTATDADTGAVLTYSLETGPTNGTVTVNPDGTFTYQGNADFHGADSFVFLVEDEYGATDTETVSVTVDPVNDDPTANNDTGAVTEDGTLVANGNLGASDIDGDSLTYTVVGGGTSAYGSLVVDAGGTWTYTLNNGANAVQNIKPGESPVDAFQILVEDGNGGSVTAEVDITINGAAMLSDFSGATVSTEWINSGNPYNHRTATVDSGVEFNFLDQPSIADTIDIFADQIVFTFSANGGIWNPAAAPVGPKIIDEFDEVADIVGVTFNAASTATGYADAGITFGDDFIFFDWEGEQIVAGQTVIYDVLFA